MVMEFVTTLAGVEGTMQFVPLFLLQTKAGTICTIFEQNADGV